MTELYRPSRRSLLAATASLAAAAALPRRSRAADKEVTFAYQDMVVPFRVVMEQGGIEKATGYKVNWRKFGGGADVVRAMASGNVALGEAGSSPIAAAASQGLDIELFWILDDIGDAEQLVARDGSGVTTIAGLKGKTVATPFVSTSHYQLMYALQKAGLAPGAVNVVNMRPPEIAAAWERGDIDRDLHLGPGARQGKGERQGSHLRRGHRQGRPPHLRRSGWWRRPGRPPILISWSRWSSCSPPPMPPTRPTRRNGRLSRTR